MEKTTRRLTEAEAAAYKDKTPLAEGYKILKWDWTGRGEYCYADADGIVEGAKLHIFNTPVSEERYKEVANMIGRLAGGWYPNFTNAEELRAKSDGGEWKATPADRIKGRTAAEAYADMPKPLLDYIRSLPEFDEDIFNAITGGAFAERSGADEE